MKGYDEKRIVLMTKATGNKDGNFYPTGKKIRKQLNLLLGNCTPEDTVILCFSGHGLQFKNDQEHYFCPSDAEIKDRTTLISIPKVYEKLNACKASGKVLLVDACRNDPLVNFTKGPRLQLDMISSRLEVPEKGGTVAFFSCSEGQESYEDDKVGRGVFFHYVNKALSGEGDRQGNGDVTFMELQMYAANNTKDHVRQAFGEFQQPTLRIPADFESIVLIKGSGPPKFISNKLGMRLKLISRGKFNMGADPENNNPNERDRPFMVEITKGFYMGSTEVTQAQWYAVMKTKPWEESAFPDFPMYISDPDRPASYISWNDAEKFCRKLSEMEGRVYRLPTEAEWEYACRAPKGYDEVFNFGDDVSKIKDYAWYLDENNEKSVDKAPEKVAQKAPNGFGLYDMHGNVYEWCSNWCGPYPKESCCDPLGPESGRKRVLRGGSFTVSASFCKSAARHFTKPSHGYPEFGLRVVLEQKSKQEALAEFNKNPKR